MALPQNTTVSPFKTQETDYGNEQGLFRRAPATSSVHPLEASENTYHKRQEDLRMTSVTKAYGLGFVMHLKHERAAAGCREIGHMGFLPRSNAHIDALTGRDLDFDFGDTLATEPEASRNPHLLMENLQKTPRFRF
ncbi:hypothetical protein SK128_013269 [Halocaridina rubra]|uniref:Uncharacterized protein n=1 Tax=Halocaridina rubra TaxID=373956 RepID=A0AAN8XE24_HALRR